MITRDLPQVMARLTQREDDTEEALKKRLVAYGQNKSAVLEAFFAQHGEMSGGLATAAIRDDLR